LKWKNVQIEKARERGKEGYKWGSYLIVKRTEKLKEKRREREPLRKRNNGIENSQRNNRKEG
jgi:hypothetical protein